MKISEIIRQEDSGILIIELIGNNPDLLIPQLSNFDDYLSEYQNIQSDKRKIEFLSVRIAVNHLLGKNVRISYKDSGKPYLSDNNHFISISHTRNHVAVMASDQFEPGIDIEQISDIERFRKVSGRYLSEEEIKTLKIDAYPEILAISWSIKEAVYKMLGEETVHFSEKIQIKPFTPENEGLAEVFLPARNKTITVQYRKNDNYTLAWCSGKRL